MTEIIARKKIFFYIFGIIVWVIVFVFLTQIVLFLTGRNLKKSTINPDMKGDEVYFSIADIHTFDNLYNEININGWAFIETEKDDPDKEVKLIFVSDKASYEVDMALIFRPGLANALGGKKVSELRAGINRSFSPLGMRNGEYTLYIYVYENEGVYGIINTGLEFRKDYGNFVQITGGELMDSEDFSNANNNEAVKWNVDVRGTEDNEVILSGWAFIENAESSKNRVYLEIVKPDGSVSIYSTKRIYREGLGEYFNDDRYIAAGFQVELPIDAFGKGENTVTAIIGMENRADQYVLYNWQGDEEN